MNQSLSPNCIQPLKSILIGIVSLLLCANSFAQRSAAYEEEPINYSDTKADNRAEAIEEAWLNGEIEGVDDYGLTALKAFLKSFEIPQDSQTLVFSKTSLQISRITPSNPRAIYFSDDAYFGWVPGGIYELTLNDPELGLVFYEVDPFHKRIRRNRDCLSCHGGSRTGGWPGVLIRSVFPKEDGHPMGQAGGHVTRHESPIEERWGGWYVTGKHGESRHMGNEIASSTGSEAFIDREKGANVTDLGGYFDKSLHLRADSDIVSLMVLEHQCEMHNRLSRGMLRIRKWAHRQAEFQRMMGELVSDEPTGTLLTVLNGETERIVEYLLFSEEIRLPEEGIEGTDDFEKSFRTNRKEDAKGRSLKDFNLDSRLFEYRCSYMIYSEAFELMPDMLKRSVYKLLFEVLESDDPPEGFSHLPSRERRAIREILLETKPEIKELVEFDG